MASKYVCLGFEEQGHAPARAPARYGSVGPLDEEATVSIKVLAES